MIYPSYLQHFPGEAGVCAVGSEDSRKTPKGTKASDRPGPPATPHNGKLLPNGHQAEVERGAGTEHLHRNSSV